MTGIGFLMLADKVYQWVYLSVIVWIVSTSLARARAFRPFRQWVRSKSAYFGEGVSCQFCISHWVGFILTLLVRPTFLTLGKSVGFYGSFLTHSFALIGLAALIARTIGKTPPNGVPHPDQVLEEDLAMIQAIGEVLDDGRRR